MEDETPLVAFRGFSGEQAQTAIIFIGAIIVLILIIQLIKAVQLKAKGTRVFVVFLFE